MRVLLLAQFLPPVPGGEERHVWNLARALAARSHDVTLMGFATVAEDPAGWATVVWTVSVGPRPHRGLPAPGSLQRPRSRPHALPLPDPAVSRAISR